MYICYLDESGNVERTPDSPYFVLLGLSIPAVTWRARDKEINHVLNAHNLYGEIHTAWMARYYPEQNRIPGFAGLGPEERADATRRERKIDLGRAALKGHKAVRTLARNYAKTDAYLHLTHGERIDILRAVADLIGSREDATLFADAQRKSAHRVGARQDRVMDHAFEQVVTRFNTYLGRVNADIAILVQDQNDTASKRLTALARRFYRTGTAYSRIDRIIETPLFVDSKLTAMVQMADLCAYATRRFFEKGETDLFDRIYGRFDRLNGTLVGLRHYTGSQRCRCRVCRDHGR
jgi:hypothetical protein